MHAIVAEPIKTVSANTMDIGIYFVDQAVQLHVHTWQFLDKEIVLLDEEDGVFLIFGEELLLG